jgi:hypothetical protein
VFDEWVLSIGITFQTVKTAAGLMIAKWRIFRGVHEYLLDIDCGCLQALLVGGQDTQRLHLRWWISKIDVGP